MNNKAQTRTRCVALTRSGQPCKNYALSDSEYCRLHQPGNKLPDGRTAKSSVGQEIDHDLRRQLAAELDRLTVRARLMPTGNASGGSYPAQGDDLSMDADGDMGLPLTEDHPKEKNGRYLYDADAQWLSSRNEMPKSSPFGWALLGLGIFILLRWLLGRKSS